MGMFQEHVREGMLDIPEIGPTVFCTFRDSFGEDPWMYTNVVGGIAFCASCGDTDHKVIEGGKS